MMGSILAGTAWVHFENIKQEVVDTEKKKADAALHGA
jgi:hypothetical protein